MSAIFWFFGFLIAYIYIGYPLLVHLIRPFRRAPKKNLSTLPSVSVLIPAFNEANVIRDTLTHLLASDYPKDRIEVIVVSDQSDDGTDDIVLSVANQSDIPIRLVRQEPRKGKTSGLNMIVPLARGEIIVFCDANSIYAVDTITQLVNHFADPAVGYVTGKMVYVKEDGSWVGDGCSAYMKYENWLRANETRLGSVVGVDGGVDAMRKRLYSMLDPDQLPDFVQPLKVVEKGYRVVYEPDAILMEHALADSRSEYRMRVRVCLRALWALHDMRHLLNPLQFPMFSWQLFSHKVLRYLAFVPLFMVFLINILLLGSGSIYVILFILQLFFYGLALIAYKSKRLDKLPKLFVLPYYFFLVNVASAHALLRYLKGEKQVLWTPRLG